MGHQDAREKRTEATQATAVTDVATLQTQRVQKATLAIVFGDLTDSDGAQTIPFAAALPTGAVILAVGIDVLVGFTDGVAGVFTADVGVNGGDIDAYMDGSDIASVAEVSSPKGVIPSGLASGVTPAVTMLADVNVDTATAGSLLAVVTYVDRDVL